MNIELINIISEILGILLFGGVTIGMWLGIFQDLNLRKKYHDREMEKLNLEILRLEQQISDGDKITQKTIHQLKSCTKVL